MAGGLVTVPASDACFYTAFHKCVVNLCSCPTGVIFFKLGIKRDLHLQIHLNKMQRHAPKFFCNLAM